MWSGTLLEYSSHCNTHFIVKNTNKPKKQKQNDLMHVEEEEEGYLSSSSSFASNSSFSLTDTKCIFSNIGCKFDATASMLNTTSIEVHMQMSSVHHLELMNNYFSSLLCHTNKCDTTKNSHSLNKEFKTKLHLTCEQNLLSTSQDLTDQLG